MRALGGGLLWLDAGRGKLLSLPVPRLRTELLLLRLAKLLRRLRHVLPGRLVLRAALPGLLRRILIAHLNRSFGCVLLKDVRLPARVYGLSQRRVVLSCLSLGDARFRAMSKIVVAERKTSARRVPGPAVARSPRQPPDTHPCSPVQSSCDSGMPSWRPYAWASPRSENYRSSLRMSVHTVS